MSVQVSIRAFEIAHGKGPKGTGTWRFADRANYDFDGNTRFFEQYGTYSEARKAAVRWGKENQIMTVHVLP